MIRSYSNLLKTDDKLNINVTIASSYQGKKTVGIICVDSVQVPCFWKNVGMVVFLCFTLFHIFYFQGLSCNAIMVIF